MSNIYISYHQDDSKFVGSLTKRLEARGYRIFTRENVTPGMPTSQEIARLIYQCHTFMIVLSSRAVSSKEMAKELNYAVGQGKKIVPIVTESATYPGNMAYILGPMASIDAKQLGSEEGLERLVNVLPPPVHQPKRAGLGSGGKIALYGIIGLIVLAVVAALVFVVLPLLSSPTLAPTQAPLPQQTSPAEAPAPTALPVTTTTTFTLTNGWPESICYVYIAPSGSAPWGENQIVQPIPPGYPYIFTVPVGTYKMRVGTCTGYYEDYPEVQLTQPGDLTVY